MKNIKSTRPKSRKEHICDYCREIIKKGEVYEKQVNSFDGDIYTWKSHIKCQEVSSLLKMHEECDEGVTSQDFEEILTDYFRNNFLETNETNGLEMVKLILNTQNPIKAFSVRV